jgi:predicted transcriptional regulator
MLSRVEEEIELLERHMKILRLVIESEPIGIIKLSETSKMPQHKIRYSLRVLEQKGMIKPSQKGAVTTDEGKRFLEDLPKNLGPLFKKIKDLGALD